MEYDIDELNNLKKAHNELMVEYVNIINRVSKLPFLLSLDLDVSPEGNTFLKNFNEIKIPTLRFIVKLFVESHIKGKLNQLGDSYVQNAQVISMDGPTAKEYLDWLKQAEEGTKKFASTLSSWQSIRGLASVMGALGPLGSGLLIVSLKVENIYQGLVKIVPLFSLYTFSIILYFLFTMVYFWLVIFSAFNYKRNLFYPGSGFELFTLVRRSRTQQVSVKNVYKIEDKLFEILGKGKTLELPIDIIAYSLLTFTIGIFSIWGSIKEQEGNMMPYLSYLTAAFSIFGGIYLLVVGFQRRKYR